MADDQTAGQAGGTGAAPDSIYEHGKPEPDSIYEHDTPEPDSIYEHDDPAQGDGDDGDGGA